MNVRSAIAAGLSILVLGLLSGDARAQGGYRPNRPTLSPWLNLYQRNSGPVDNYHTFVQPRIQLQETLSRQDAINRQQAAAMNAMNSRIAENQAQVAPRPTGSPATFFQYSHYYPRGSGMSRGSQRNWSPSPARSGSSGM